NNDNTCWGVTNVSRHTEQGSVACYPDVCRGLMFNQTAMQQLSTPNTNDWTTTSGMGIQLSALTKCKVKWSIQSTPVVPSQSRWDALIDVYVYPVAQPLPTATPKYDISIFQMVMDANYYGPTYTSEHGCPITIGGIQYAVIVDESDGFNVFNAAGGHYILMLCRPSAPNDGLPANSLWGQQNVTHDVAAICRYWQQSNPLDDNGNPVKNGHTGVNITSPLLTSAMFLNAINYGFEVDFVHNTADSFVTGHGTQILMQNEVTSPPGVTVAPNFSITGTSFAHGSKLTVNMTSGTFPARNFGTAPWLYDN